MVGFPLLVEREGVTSFGVDRSTSFWVVATVELLLGNGVDGPVVIRVEHSGEEFASLRVVLPLVNSMDGKRGFCDGVNNASGEGVEPIEEDWLAGLRVERPAAFRVELDRLDDFFGFGVDRVTVCVQWVGVAQVVEWPAIFVVVAGLERLARRKVQRLACLIVEIARQDLPVDRVERPAVFVDWVWLACEGVHRPACQLVEGRLWVSDEVSRVYSIG